MAVPITETLAAVVASSDATPSTGSPADWAALAVIVLAVALLAWSLRGGRGGAGRGSVRPLAVRAMAVGILFGVLTAQVATSGWLTGADRPTLDWLTAHRSATWTSIAEFVTNIGGPPGAIAIGAAIAAFLAWRTRRPMPVAVVLGTVTIALAANTAMKYLIGRERPQALARLADETSLSYPSGHVAGTTALVGVALLVYLAGRPTRGRAAIASAAAALLVAIIALTRLYLGVHWLTDTVGGALLGTTVVLAVAAALAAGPALDIHARTSRAGKDDDPIPVGQVA